ncbi:MAG: CARDB domain-containing protein [Candidatus Bathyarchaeota archaeon]|jgi:hypothetical protein
MIALNLTGMNTSAAVSPYIGVVPESTMDEAVTPGMNYTISIYTDYIGENGDNITGWQFELTFNPDVLQGVEVVNGDLITGPWQQFTTAGFNNTAGRLRYTWNGFFFFPPDPPQVTSGPGTLANVTFTVVGYGSSNITLETQGPYRTLLIGGLTEEPWTHNIIDSEANPEQIQHGFFSNAPDLEVTSVTPSVVEAKPGTIVDIDINITNTGTPSGSFNVSTYYDSTEINKTELPGLGTGEDTTLSVPWNTTGMSEGNYTIKAYAWPVSNEADTADNTYIDGEVRITSLIHDVAVTNVTASPSMVPVGDTVDITVTAKNKGTEIETFDVTAYYDDNAIGTQTVTDLDPDVEEILTFLWDTTGIAGGNHTIKATASTVSGEANLADNTYIDGEVKVMTHDVAVSSVTVPTTITVGETTTINATLENEGTETETFSVSAHYDTNLIETKSVTNLAGGATTNLTFTWDTTGISPGDYTIAITAETVSEETDTADNAKTVQVHLIKHEVAVASITLSPTSADVGENVTITVIVENQGTETETFNVKVSYGTTEIGTADVTDLDPDAQKTLTFTWETTGLDAGEYTIKAVASTVTGETDTTNNTKIYGTFTLSQPISGWLPIELWVVIIVVAVAIIAVGFYIISMRRRKTP